MIQFIIGAAAVIGVAAKVISYVMDELSEEEYREQDRIRSDYEDYRRQREREAEEVLRKQERALDELSKEERDRLNELEKAYAAELKQRRTEYYEKLCARIELHEGRRRELNTEIYQSTKRILKILSEEQATYLRRQSLEQLLHTLQEAQSKLKAYLNYLKRYRRELDKAYHFGADFPEPFVFLLPDTYPYNGKIIYQKKEELAAAGVWKVAEGMMSDYRCADLDTLEDYADDASIPLFVEQFDLEQRAYIVSVAKGIFKHTALFQPGIGLEATVRRHEKNEILLAFRDFELKLYRNQLENPRRTPPRGTRLRVFPKRWSFNLKFPPQVTEKYEESLAVSQFEQIPVVLHPEVVQPLQAWFTEHDEWEQSDEWKIAPMREQDIPHVLEVKLQYGHDLVIRARLVQHGADRSYLELAELLPLEQACKPADVFVAVKAQLFVWLQEDLGVITVSQSKELNDLCLFLLQEYKTQQAIKLAHAGIQYYNKWAELTDQLIHYHYKGDDVFVEAERVVYLRKDVKSGLSMYRAYIDNVEQVKAFLAETGELRRAEYFLEDHEGRALPVEFVGTAEAMHVFGNFTESGETTLRVYQKRFPYPEIQQKQALNVFREGRVQNPKLKTYLLDPGLIEANRAELGDLTFFNERLSSNPTQRDVVERALAEQDFFMIQGPPGTGKTTVILELIRQTRKLYPRHRILIVSQANVAVDNVMKDLVHLYDEGELIRCGRDTQIDEAVKPASFEEKYASYLRRIEALAVTEVNRQVLGKWKEIISSELGRFNSDVGELILKGHPLVGATCVGLAQKKVGLDRLDFDLVIIDEAGKALPAELLIPINRAKKLILIGDHLQLPPTIDTALFDEEKIEVSDREYVQDELFETSLFERLYLSCPDTNKGMLRTQYRMPEAIGSMISELFYDGELANGDSTSKKRRVFFPEAVNVLDLTRDRQYRETEERGRSPRNTREAEVVAAVVQSIRAWVGDRGRIAIITPYRGQASLIRNNLLRVGIHPYGPGLAVNTVDAFQGDEAEIVIYCMTRAHRKTAFFSKNARINVALSRTKNDLLIIGSLSYMKSYGEDSPLHRIASYTEAKGHVYTRLEPFQDNREGA